MWLGFPLTPYSYDIHLINEAIYFPETKRKEGRKEGRKERREAGREGGRKGHRLGKGDIIKHMHFIHIECPWDSHLELIYLYFRHNSNEHDCLSFPVQGSRSPGRRTSSIKKRPSAA